MSIGALVAGAMVVRGAAPPAVLLQSHLDDLPSVLRPTIGAGGTTSLGAEAFGTSGSSDGARFTRDGNTLSFPVAIPGGTFPSAGEVEFWFQPEFAVEDDETHHILFSIGDIYGAPRIELRESGSLTLSIVVPRDGQWVTHSVASDYRRSLWRPGQWVHLRAGWNPADPADSLRLHVDSRRVHGSREPGGWGPQTWPINPLHLGSGRVDLAPGVTTGQFPAGGRIRDVTVRAGFSSFDELPYVPDGGGGGIDIDPADPTPIPDPVPITTRVPDNLGWRVPSMGSPTPSPVGARLDLPLTVKEIAGDGVADCPVSVVVPLPYGQHQDTGSFRVLDPGGREVPAQFRVINRHWNKDRSIRHVLVVFEASVGAFVGPGTGQAVYRLVNGRDGPPPVPAGGSIELSDTDGVIELRTAGQRFRIRRSPFAIETPLGELEARMLVRSGADVVVQNSFRRDPAEIRVTIEESGPLRAVVRVSAPTVYLSPTNHTHGWAIRLYLHSGKPDLKIDVQAQNSAINQTYSRPLYFESYEVRLMLPQPQEPRAIRSRADADDPAGLGPLLGAGLLTSGQVQVIYRNFEQQWPSGMALDGDGRLRVELWPEWSSQRQGNRMSPSGLHWLDDMQHTLKEFVLHFGPMTGEEASAIARRFQFPPVTTLPFSWYADTRVTCDLGGALPPPPAGFQPTDRRLPDYRTYGGRYEPVDTQTPLSELLGVNRFGLDEPRRIGTSMAGGWPYSVNRFLLTGDPADYHYGVDFAMAELNIRPQWLAGYRFSRDFNRIRPSENPYLPDANRPDLVRNWRRFVANGRPKLDAGGGPDSTAYLSGTGPNAYAREDQHGWSYQVDEAYQYSGNPWMRDWLEFLGEFRKTRLNQLDPFPDMAARALGHSLAQAVASYKATGDDSLRISIRNFIHRHFQFVEEPSPPANPFRGDITFLHRDSGGRAYYLGGSGPTGLEAPFQLGYLSRAIINYLEELGEPDPYALAIVAGFAHWNLNYAHFGYYQQALTVNRDSDGSAMTLVDPVLWVHSKTGDATLRDHAFKFVDEGWGTPREFASLRPYIDLRRWTGDFNGRLASLMGTTPNRPPVLAGATNATINELVGHTQNLNPMDPDLPAQSLTVALISGPPGLVVTNGVLAWTPTEDQGPSNHLVTVTVTDGALVTTNRFTLTVSGQAGPSRISGRVEYYRAGGGGVPGVRVTAEGPGGGSMTTGPDGGYSMEVNGTEFTITPTLTTDQPPAAGVTTGDIALIRRHVLGVAPLDWPHPLIAGDVDGSDSVTTADITLIRRLILGLSTNYPVDLWRFVPSDEGIDDPARPWTAARIRRLALIAAGNLEGQDFRAIKLGDVNGSWTAPAAAAGSANSPKDRPLGRLMVGGASASTGETVVLPVQAFGLTSLTSLQFSLRWNPKLLELAAVEGFRLPGLEAENFNIEGFRDGLLSVSWDPRTGLDVGLAGLADLFRLRFKVTAPAGTTIEVAFSETPTPVEAGVAMRTVSVGREPGVLTVTRGALVMPESLELKVAGISVDDRLELEVRAPLGVTVSVEGSDLIRPWSPVGRVVGLGAQDAVRVFLARDPESGSQFWRLRLPAGP